MAANDLEEERGFGWRGWSMAAATVALIAVVGTLFGLQLRDPVPDPARTRITHLETGLGRVQARTLEDGSRVEMGGKSALAVQYSDHQRLVVAEQGEAFFEVAHNRDRPFIVQAGPVTVTAVGTAFSVQRDADTISVNVTEGVVEVRAAPRQSGGDESSPRAVLRVPAGYRARFDGPGLTQSVEPVQADLATPWREGRLEFRDEPLSVVVARINRYSRRQIDISDPSIAGLRVTTTVYRDRIDGWLQSIPVVLPVRVSVRGDDRAVISPAA